MPEQESKIFFVINCTDDLISRYENIYPQWIDDFEKHSSEFDCVEQVFLDSLNWWMIEQITSDSVECLKNRLVHEFLQLELQENFGVCVEFWAYRDIDRNSEMAGKTHFCARFFRPLEEVE